MEYKGRWYAVDALKKANASKGADAKLWVCGPITGYDCQAADRAQNLPSDTNRFRVMPHFSNAVASTQLRILLRSI